jgi:outer membrane receptor for ferric coprogen and ferric-rhodotorulic acid
VVWDIDLGWKLNARQELSLQIDNVADKYYYEKNDFPFHGRSFFARFRHSF